MRKILSGVAFLVAFTTPTFAAELTFTDDELLFLGKKIYERAAGRGCGACHDVRPFPDLTKSIKKLSQEEFFKVVREGRPGTIMTAMLPQIMKIGLVKKHCLTEEQALEALYRYLNALADGKAGGIKKPKSLKEKAKACKGMKKG